MRLQKVVPPGGDEAGGTDDRRGEPITPVSLSGSNIKKSSVSRERYYHPADIDFVLERIRAGQSVTEADAYTHSRSRFRRAMCKSILREIHRRRPDDTNLILSGGLWTLIPLKKVHP